MAHHVASLEAQPDNEEASLVAIVCSCGEEVAVNSGFSFATVLDLQRSHVIKAEGYMATLPEAVYGTGKEDKVCGCGDPMMDIPHRESDHEDQSFEEIKAEDAARDAESY